MDERKRKRGKRMKKWLTAALCALVMLALIPSARAKDFGTYKAVVANPVVTDRLNLRIKPDTDSESLGRFYSGTPVTVADDGIREGWALVTIGELTGYVRTEYLMRENRNYEAPKLFSTARLKKGSAYLRSAPEGTGEQMGLISGFVYVLGDVGDDWRYVQAKDKYDRVLYGYVRTSELTDHATAIEMAYLWPARGGDRVTVYAEKELKTAKAFYYAGAPVRVTDSSRAGWARVECPGVLPEEDTTVTVQGYVKAEDLKVFCQPWEVMSRAKAGLAARDLTLPESPHVFVPKGAALVVVGETAGKYHIIYGNAFSGLEVTDLVDQNDVVLTGETADRMIPPRRAFALLPQEAGEIPLKDGTLDAYAGLTDLTLCEIIGEGDTWYQMRQAFRPGFFVEKEGVRVVSALMHDTEDIRGAGAWTAAEKDAGLWVLTVEAGKSGSVTLKNPDAYHGAESPAEDYRYTFYIAPGTEVNAEGDAILTAATEGSLQRLLPAHPADTYSDRVVFSGSGRFFCDLQLPEDANYYSWRVRPIPGSEDSWLRVSSIFTDACGAWDGVEAVRLAGDFDGGAQADIWYLDLFPGQFLEVTNCIIEIYYGNG